MTVNEKHLIFAKYKKQNLNKIRMGFIHILDEVLKEIEISTIIKTKLYDFINSVDDYMLFELFMFYKGFTTYTDEEFVKELIDIINEIQ